MTVTRDFFAFLSTIIICLCEPDRPLHPPTNVSFHWIDDFVLQVDWTERKNPSCQVKYKIQGFKDLRETTKLFTRETYLTDMALSDRNISVSAVPDNCSGWTESEKVQVTITTSNHTKLVKDFKCFLESHKMKCVWTPLEPSQRLRVFYRYAGKINVSRSEQCHPVGNQHECDVNANAVDRPVWVVVKKDKYKTDKNDALVNTFIPRLVVPVPNVTIKARADNLTLTWHVPAVGNENHWNLNLNYKECNKMKTITTKMNITIPYKECCLYSFWYNISTTQNSLTVTSDDSQIMTHGQFCISASTVVTIAVPLIVFIFVLLSCYCFRSTNMTGPKRTWKLVKIKYKNIFADWNRAIICPIIPEPSDFFKEMMSGNKDSRVPIVTLYTPPEETSEPCTLISQSRDLQQIP